MKNKEIKRTITFPDPSYQIIKEFCDKNNLKIGGFAEKVLLNYIRFETKPNLKIEKQKPTPPETRILKEGKTFKSPKN